MSCEIKHVAMKITPLILNMNAHPWHGFTLPEGIVDKIICSPCQECPGMRMRLVWKLALFSACKFPEGCLCFHECRKRNRFLYNILECIN